MTLLVLATRNAHKIAEIQEILGSRFRFLALRELPPSPELVEDQLTFDGNASRKAVQVAHWMAAFPDRWQDAARSYVLADDSGLEVDALKGAPGVHSARFAHLDEGVSGNAPDAANNAKLLSLLADVPIASRTARFRCSIALAPLVSPAIQNSSPVCAADEAEAQLELFRGKCEGWIDFQPRGAGGFGYDPLFIPRGLESSFAQLDPAQKNRISHRAEALRKMRIWLLTP